MFQNDGLMVVRVATCLTLLLSGTQVCCLTYRSDTQDGRVATTPVLGVGRSSSISVSRTNTVKSMAAHTGDKHLQLYGVDVPVYKFRGEDAVLVCKYDRGNDPLYAVKWYKDDAEFYRYLFTEKRTPKKYFPSPGVVVDIHRSNERRVLLKSVSFNSTGIYRCEVSADSPHFHTFTNQSVLVVVELPHKGPTISGGLAHYTVGDTAELNCTSSRSKPAAKLTWYINDVPVSGSSLVPYYPWMHEDGLESRRLGLKFKVNKTHFFKDELTLKCLATVAAIYSATEEEDAMVYDGDPLILEQREHLIKAKSGVGKMLPTSSILVLLVALLGGRAVT